MITIGIVDPVVSANEYIRCNAYGIKIIAIFSRDLISLPAISSRVMPDLFEEVVYFEKNEDLSDLVERLRPYKIKFILNGYDRSSPLSDLLASKLCPEYSNDLTNLEAKYDKLAWQSVLCDNKINCPKTEIFKHENLNEYKTWLYPVIIKPANSAGTNNFYECNDYEHLLSITQSNLSPNNQIGIFGESIYYIIQEKIIGIEFGIDTCSINGIHHLCHIRQYKKEYFRRVPLPIYSNTIYPNDKIAIELYAYMKTVLNAVGLNNGFCHAEVFLTQNGACLIDLNPRLPGAKGAQCFLAECSYGHAHVDIFYRALLGLPMSYKYCYGKTIFLQETRVMKLGEFNQDLITECESVKKVITNYDIGHITKYPNSLGDTIAFIVMANSNAVRLESDYENILKQQQNSTLY